ncbi:hypothetical protein Tco_1119579 [Tanacetum coccineum]
MEEEHNQPKVMQELLLKLMNDLQILKGIQQEKEKPAAQTWERFGEIKHALTDKQYRQEDIQELMSKLLEDVRNISEELSEYINCPSWNRPTIFFDDDDEYTIIYSKPKAITPDLPIEEPDNSLSMGDEHLSTIPATESDEVIKSSVENLVPIPSEFEGISDDTCDVPICDDSSTFDALKDHSEILSDSNDDGTSSDDDDFEDIEYVDASPPNSKLVSLEESHSPFPIPDSNSFFEKSDTSLSYSDNSLPEFESFSDHTKETSSGSTTTHANNSLTEYDSFHFEIEPDQGELTNVVMEDILGEPRVHTPNVIPQDHEDPCLFSILQSSGL